MLQTDRRQTDGRTTTYSEREHEFTLAKNGRSQFRSPSHLKRVAQKLPMLIRMYDDVAT